MHLVFGTSIADYLAGDGQQVTVLDASQGGLETSYANVTNLPPPTSHASARVCGRFDER